MNQIKKGKNVALCAAGCVDMEEKRTANVTTSKNAKNGAMTRKMSAHPTARRRASDLTNITIVTKKKETEKKPFPWTTVFTAVCFTVMFLFMMMNYIALDDLNDEVSSRASVIEKLTEEKNMLATQVEKMDTIEEIQAYAENELGMIGVDGAAEEYYIDIHAKDEVEINHYEDEVENGIGTLLTGAGNVLKEFFRS